MQTFINQATVGISMLNGVKTELNKLNNENFYAKILLLHTS